MAHTMVIGIIGPHDERVQLKGMKMRASRVIICMVGACMVYLALLGAGCIQEGVSRERLEEIDAALHATNVGLEETTSFIGALEGFDLDDPYFIPNVLAAIQSSRGAVQRVLEGSEKLKSFNYEGKLSTLGGYVVEYCDALDEAMAELETIYAGLENILAAIEPVLKAEAEIIRIETEGTLAQWQQQVKVINSLLVPAQVAVEECQVPVQLEEFKALFVDLFRVMSKLFGELAVTDVEKLNYAYLWSNPAYIESQNILEMYPAVVQKLEDELKKDELDPLLERVELEINRLFMEEMD